MNNNDDSKRPRRPSAYVRFSTEDLLRKLKTHKGMIEAIERELLRRAEAEEPES